MPLKVQMKSHSKELVRSLLVALSFLCFGAAMVLPGVSLLDIQVRVQQPFSETSRIITLRSIGYFAGALTGKLSNSVVPSLVSTLFIVGLVERYVNHYLAMGLASFIAGGFLLLLPLMTNIIFSLVCAGLFGFGLSVLDLGKYWTHQLV